MKTRLFAIILLMLCIPFAAMAQKEDKKASKNKKSDVVLIEDITKASFVVETKSKSITFVFDGENGTLSAGGNYTLKMSKWIPKKQRVRFNVYPFGSSVKSALVDGYLTCYDDGTCQFDFYSTDTRLMEAWTSYEGVGKQSTFNLTGTYTLTE